MAKVSLTIETYDESGKSRVAYCNGFDLITVQWMQIMAANVIGVGQANVADINNATHTFNANTVCSNWQIIGGTGGTPAHVNDFHLNAPTAGSSGSTTATISAITEVSNPSGTYTVSGNIVNTSGGTVTYSELGITLQDPTNNIYLITHDVFTGLPVSNGGTMSVTYVVTNS